MYESYAFYTAAAGNDLLASGVTNMGTGNRPWKRTKKLIMEKEVMFEGVALVVKPVLPKLYSCPQCFFWDNEDCVQTCIDAGLPDCLLAKCYFTKKEVSDGKAAD
jgi:hypothetical protein